MKKKIRIKKKKKKRKIQIDIEDIPTIKLENGIGQVKIGNYEREKLKKEQNNKLLEQKKKNIRIN